MTNGDCVLLVGTVLVLSTVACFLILRLVLSNIYANISTNLAARGLSLAVAERGATRLKAQLAACWLSCTRLRRDWVLHREQQRFDGVSLALLQVVQDLPLELQQLTWSFARQQFHEECSLTLGLAPQELAQQPPTAKEGRMAEPRLSLHSRCASVSQLPV